MKYPRVIMHNTVSLDNAIDGFEVDLGLHYGIVGSYHPDVMLVGSRTARAGIEMFMSEIPDETHQDFDKASVLKNNRPYFAVPDSQGIMKGFLHIYRQSEYCREPVIFVTETTPHEYKDYLRKRDYDFFVAGKDKVDYRDAFRVLAERYDAKTVVTDTGGTLSSILLQQGLVDEISLIIAPVLVGNNYTCLFRNLDIVNNLKLVLDRQEAIGNNCRVVYRVIK